ncbi:OmpA family protein [Paraburkholderia sp.]|uniref:OmpA family protein n=1 Tax=Paraburkholderia sp. TaxID=1926495 RepID=UPI0039E299D1
MSRQVHPLRFFRALYAVISCSVLSGMLLSGCHHKDRDAAAGTAASSVESSVPASGAASGAAEASGASAAAADGASGAAASNTAASDNQPDLASLISGTFPVNTSYRSDEWIPLVNGVTGPRKVGIRSRHNPYELTLALPGEASITSFAFKSVAAWDLTAHHVKVEVSDSSASGPWSTAYDADLPPTPQARVDDEAAVFTARLQQPVSARFLKLTLSSPPVDGKPVDLGLTRFSAYGTLAAAESVRNVAGIYQFPGTLFEGEGYVLLQQQGASVEGCYFEATDNSGLTIPKGVKKVLGTITGGIEPGSYLRFMYYDVAKKTSKPGVMVLSPDGAKPYMQIYNGDAHTVGSVDDSLGDRRQSLGQLSCEPSGQSGGATAEQLEQTGRVQLYGVNFDLDRSTLRSDAQPVLDRMATLLKAHPDWKIEVAGHTDSTGGDAHNMSLSQERAEAVVQYLKTAGVTCTLTARGYGSTRPLVPNTSDTLRAENRRVELVKQ